MHTCELSTAKTRTASRTSKARPLRHRCRPLLAAGALLGACLAGYPADATASKPAPSAELATPENGWVVMPAGAKSAYIGIHGGTVPVSLLATSEGTSLVSFVGRTGNDFLDLLHRADLRMPSLLNGTAPRGSDGSTPKDIDLASLRARHLMAGSASNSLPVIYLNGESLAKLSSSLDTLTPFGLSDTPLSIEGEVAMPDPFQLAPRYHILVDPKYLQPRRQ